MRECGDRNMSSFTHKDLDIWKEGIDLIEKIYKITNNTKPNVKSNSNFFTNILIYHKSCHFEGVSPKNLLLHGWFCINYQKMKNLETLLIIALKLNYLSEAIFDEISETIEKLRRMILNFIKYQKKKSSNT